MPDRQPSPADQRKAVPIDRPDGAEGGAQGTSIGDPNDAAGESVKDVEDREEKPEGEVEESSDQSFPASDPPSW